VVRLNLLTLEGGELFTLTEGGELIDAGFTPSGEPSLFSIYRGRIVRREEHLGGFFVDFGDGEGFLPFSKTSKGRKVGDYLTLQVVREAVGDKPPRFSEFLTIPAGGCRVLLDGRGRVLLPKGLKVELKPFKEFAKRLGASVVVGSPDCDLGAAERIAYFFKNLRAERGVGLLFKWRAHYEPLITHGGRLVADDGRALEGAKNFLNLLEKNWEAELLPTRRAVKGAKISTLKGLLFGERFNFEGGNLVFKHFEGFVGVDVNGFGNHFEINRRGFELLLKLLRISKTGGLTAVDLITPKTKEERERLKETLRELVQKIHPFCKALGFTNGGLFELFCPFEYKPLRLSLGVPNPYCPSERVPSDELLALSVLEKLPSSSGDYLIRLHPLRVKVAEKLRGFVYGKLKVEEDWKIPPSEVFVQNL